jgi:hypothetical protein
MTTPKPIRSSGVYESPSRAEKLEEDASLAGAVGGEALSAVEVGAVVLVGLLVCPPLAIAAFVVVVPLLVAALVLGLVVAVLSTPYLLVHHFRAHDRRHLSLLSHRLRHAARALVDLLPHRIVADAGKVDGGR